MLLTVNYGVTKADLRRFIIAGTIAYTALVLYFMFYGFNRIDDKINYNQYTFLLIPERILLRFPQLTMSWLYDFGNIAAFIPFGIIIPLMYRIRFRKFIAFFILVISSLEVLQSLTFLGTFDVMDIMSNTLGAVIGFVAYKVGFSPQITFKKLAASAVSVIILFIAIMVVSEAIDYGIHVNERLGPVIPLNELSTSTPIAKDFSTFTVQGKTVKPQFNIFSSDKGKVKEYSYHLNKKNLWLYANFGIPTHGLFNGSYCYSDTKELFNWAIDGSGRKCTPILPYYWDCFDVFLCWVPGYELLYDYA